MMNTSGDLYSKRAPREVQRNRFVNYHRSQFPDKNSHRHLSSKFFIGHLVTKIAYFAHALNT